MQVSDLQHYANQDAAGGVVQRDIIITRTNSSFAIVTVPGQVVWEIVAFSVDFDTSLNAVDAFAFFQIVSGTNRLIFGGGVGGLHPGFEYFITFAPGLVDYVRDDGGLQNTAIANSPLPTGIVLYPGTKISITCEFDGGSGMNIDPLMKVNEAYTAVTEQSQPADAAGTGTHRYAPTIPAVHEHLDDLHDELHRLHTLS